MQTQPPTSEYIQTPTWFLAMVQLNVSLPRRTDDSCGIAGAYVYNHNVWYLPKYTLKLPTMQYVGLYMINGPVYVAIELLPNIAVRGIGAVHSN